MSIASYRYLHWQVVEDIQKKKRKRMQKKDDKSKMYIWAVYFDKLKISNLWGFTVL